MGKDSLTITYALAMIASLVIIDIVFFRHRFGERLVVNIGIVILYAAFYLGFLNKR